MEERDDSLLHEERASIVNILEERSNSPQQTETAMEGTAKVATWLSHNVATTLRLQSMDMDKIEVMPDEGDDLSILTRTTSLGSKSVSSLTSPSLHSTEINNRTRSVGSKSISSLTSPGPGDDKPGNYPGANTPDHSRPKRGSSRKKNKKVSVTSLYSTVSSHDPYIQLMHHDSIDRRMSGESVDQCGRTRKISEGPGILSMMMGARSRQDSLATTFDDIEMDPMEEDEEAQDDTGNNALQVPDQGNLQRQGVCRLSGRRAKYANLKKGGSSVFDDYARAMRDRQKQAHSQVTQDDTEEHNDNQDEDEENTKEDGNDVEGSPCSQVTEQEQTLAMADTTELDDKCKDTTPTVQPHEPMSLKPPKPPEARRSSWAPGSGLGLPPKLRHPPGGSKTGSIDTEMEGVEKGSIPTGRFIRGEKGRATWSPAEIKARGNQHSEKTDRQQSVPSFQQSQSPVKRSNSVRNVRSSFQKVGDGLAKTFRQFKGKQHKV